VTLALASKLLSLLLTVATGWLVGRAGWLGQHSPSRVLGLVALHVFIPALLFRTAARVDLTTLPWTMLLALFLPLLAWQVLQWTWLRREPSPPPGAAGTRALATTFGNTVQVGIPVAAALFGDAGLALHVTIVSLHALVLLPLLTALTELEFARRGVDDGDRRSLARTLAGTLRNTVVHPVVLPVLLGLAWHLVGTPLPALVDDVLALLASAVVPLCLVLIGVSLAEHGLARHGASALRLAGLKLLVTPALVLVSAHWVFGLAGLPLAVVVMLSALPIGANAQIFAQRYRTLEAEVGAAVVLSTLAFALTGPLWLLLLSRLAAP
jgi:predicted permease